MKKEQVYRDILEIAKRISKDKGGTLFVIGPKRAFRGTYRLLYPQLAEGHMINEKGMDAVIRAIATLDGAIIISDYGEIIAYGAMLKHTKTVPGFGTKHAAASGITCALPRATAILVSEKMEWIKVFQKGKITLEMDSSDNPKSLLDKIVLFLADKDTAIITAAGASAALVGVGPVLVLSGTYLAVKTASGVIKKNLKNFRM